jgi:hypothetical protein
MPPASGQVWLSDIFNHQDHVRRGFPTLRLAEDKFAISRAIVEDEVELLDDVDQRLTAGGKIILIQFPLAMARDDQPPLAPGPWDCRLLVEGAADHPRQCLILCGTGGPVLTEGLVATGGYVGELEGPCHWHTHHLTVSARSSARSAPARRDERNRII